MGPTTAFPTILGPSRHRTCLRGLTQRAIEATAASMHFNEVGSVQNCTLIRFIFFSRTPCLFISVIYIPPLPFMGPIHAYPYYQRRDFHLS